VCVLLSYYEFTRATAPAVALLSDVIWIVDTDRGFTAGAEKQEETSITNKSSFVCELKVL